MSTTIEREPEVTERPTDRPPPLIHYFRPRWWEIAFVPQRFWRVREGDVTFCGLRCNWTTPRGEHLKAREGQECAVCRELSKRSR